MIVHFTEKKHLATYKAYKDSMYRCLVTCEYLLMIADGNGKIYTKSLANLAELTAQTEEEHIQSIIDDDCFIPYSEEIIDELEVNQFIRGKIEEGYPPLYSLREVMRNLTIARDRCTSTVKKLFAILDQ